MQKQENHFPLESIKLRTAIKTMLLSLQANLTKKLKFKGECAAIVKSIVEKLQKRLPLKHLFVRSLWSLVPKNMIESKNCPSKFKHVVDKLFTSNHINSKEVVMPNFSWWGLSQAQQTFFVKISFLVLALLIIVWIIFTASIHKVLRNTKMYGKLRW